ncbi:MAG: hypothetical protein EHM91_07635, partial [Planctomycetota bacterium]
MKTPTKEAAMPVPRRAALLAGLSLALGLMTSCVPFFVILPVPAPMILNHPYLARIIDGRDRVPVEGAAVRVEVYTKAGSSETLVRDYVVRSDARGTIYIPRESKPGLIFLWTAGILVFGPRGGGTGVADGGVAGLPDATRIVLTVTRDGFEPRRLQFIEE